MSQQQAFNAATVINHLKKLHSESSKAPRSGLDGPDDLDPNGNPVPDSGHPPCSIPGNVCTLFVCPGEPDALVAADAAANVREDEVQFTPSKR